MSREVRDDTRAQKSWDLISRGSRKPSPAGTLTFALLRLLDLPWQYHLLRNGAAERAVAALGLSAISHGGHARTGVVLLDRLGLPWPRLIVLALATGSTLKQIFWQTYLSKEEFPVSAAIPVSIYNSFLNTANTLLFVCASTSSWLSTTRISLFGNEVPVSFVLGTSLYVIGITIETLSEYQRLRFKDDPRNQGKLCKHGLWSWARHINYFGYSLWRGGYCMVGASWIGGVAMTLFQIWDLGIRATGTLDTYCSNKYGEQWRQFKKEVPYKIVPGIW